MFTQGKNAMRVFCLGGISLLFPAIAPVLCMKSPARAAAQDARNVPPATCKSMRTQPLPGPIMPTLRSFPLAPAIGG